MAHLVLHLIKLPPKSWFHFNQISSPVHAKLTFSLFPQLNLTNGFISFCFSQAAAPNILPVSIFYTALLCNRQRPRLFLNAAISMPYHKPESFIWIFRAGYCVCCVMTRWSGVASYNQGSCPSAENRREQHRY